MEFKEESWNLLQKTLNELTKIQRVISEITVAVNPEILKEEVNTLINNALTNYNELIKSVENTRYYPNFKESLIKVLDKQFEYIENSFSLPEVLINCYEKERRDYYEELLNWTKKQNKEKLDKIINHIYERLEFLFEKRGPEDFFHSKNPF